MPSLTETRVELHVDPHIAHAASSMLHSHVSGVPLIDTIFHVLADLLTVTRTEETPADVELRHSVLTELDSKIGHIKGLVKIDVHHGVAEIRGFIVDGKQLRALREVFKHMPNISSFHDHLVWIDPASGAFLGSPEDSALSHSPAEPSLG